MKIKKAFMIKAWKIQDGSTLDFKFWIEIITNVDSVRANRIFKFITGTTQCFGCTEPTH